MDGSDQIACVCTGYCFDYRLDGKASFEIEDLEEDVDKRVLC